METTLIEPISVIQASQKSKSELISLLYDREEWGFIQPNLPENLWLDYHPPIHIWDTRTKKVVNLMRKGIEDGKFYQSIFASSSYK